jgi:hypothetical protein
MSEHRPESEETRGVAADKASSPSRRRALKAALAATPIIMSIKSRPAFGGPACDQLTESCAGSSRLSARPA